jgi:hypothetical protein
MSKFWSWTRGIGTDRGNVDTAAAIAVSEVEI